MRGNSGVAGRYQKMSTASQLEGGAFIKLRSLKLVSRYLRSDLRHRGQRGRNYLVVSSSSHNGECPWHAILLLGSSRAWLYPPEDTDSF